MLRRANAKRQATASDEPAAKRACALGSLEGTNTRGGQKEQDSPPFLVEQTASLSSVQCLLDVSVFSVGELPLEFDGASEEVAPDAASLAVTPDASRNHLLWENLGHESSEASRWCFDAALEHGDVEDSPLLL